MKDLIKGSTPEKQMLKLMEELPINCESAYNRRYGEC